MSTYDLMVSSVLFLFGGVILGFSAGKVCGAVSGREKTRRRWQGLAVLNDLAEWHVDPASGKTAFVWRNATKATALVDRDTTDAPRPRPSPTPPTPDADP